MNKPTTFPSGVGGLAAKGFVRVKRKLRVAPTWITPEYEAERVQALDTLNRALSPNSFPKRGAAGPPDLRHSAVKIATRIAASSQPVFVGRV